MRIKRVEIIGFKSFCDRAVVQIGQQITGVVGPNGCGKSNIVDAIRWCMGEQSAKHLRGKAMEDVIFAGSESRGPAPMAEVSLTFDDVGFSHETLELGRQTLQDEQELAALTGDAGEEEPPQIQAPAEPQTTGTWLDKDGNPIASPTEEVAELLEDKPPAFEFAQYTEVTITRRLYRDGISQYFINKTPCRLRDITDFFLGTGVGTKAYAIIEQGRIGQIVSARPMDRRAIIEEAAGITKFKSKKKAAERKLDQTRQNLMRVSDIVSELDKRMGTLRRQAQKAERYRKYKTEMKDIELWKASHRWLELAGEHSLVSGRLGEVRTELDTARTEFAIKDATVVTERAELALEERRLVGVQEKVYELENKIRLGDSKIGFELREADELDHRVAGARTEIEQVVERRTQGQLELDERRAELEALESDVSREQGEVREREAAASEARQMLVNAEGRLEEARRTIADCKTRSATSQAQLEALAQRRGETTGRFERVSGEVEAMSKNAKDLERDLRRVDHALAELRQTRLDLGTQNDQFGARKELLASEVTKGESEVEALRTDLNRRRSRLKALEEIQARYEGFARGTRAVMQGTFTERTSVRGVVADVVRAPEKLEIAVEAALGDRLGGVLVSEPSVGAAAIGYLKQESGGRSAFVPLTGRVRASGGVALDASAGVPELVGDEPVRFGFEGEGNPNRDLSAPHELPFRRAEGSSPTAVIADEGTDDGVDRVGLDLSLKVAAELRARALVAGLRADAELARTGQSLRARSLAADAALAAALEVVTSFTGVPEVDALIEGMIADGTLATLGESLRARARYVDALISEPALADTEVASVGAALRAQTQFADATYASHAPGESFATVDGSLQAALDADCAVFSIGAELRARSLRMDAELVEDEALVSELAAMFVAEAAPSTAPAAAFAFEDRSHDPAAAAIAARHAGDDVVLEEGVLGRMIDLVGFAEGFESVGKRLLGHTVVVDHLQRAIALHEAGRAERLVTLEGDIVDDDGIVSGGSREAQGAGVLAQKREIRELHELVGTLEHQLSDAEQRLHSAKAELAQVTKAIEGLRKQVHEGEVAIVGHEKDDARVRGELERLRVRLDMLSREHIELEERLAGITSDEASHRDKLALAEEQQRVAEQTQLDLIALLGGHRERLEELAQALTEVRVRAAQAEAQRAAVETATLRLAQTDAELAARVERLRTECDDSARRAATLRESCDQLATELALTRELQASESRTLEEGRAAYTTRLEALTDIELTARELRTRSDALSNELTSLELRFGQIGMTRKVVGDQILERYQLEIEDVLPDYHQRGLVSEAEDNRLTELRELIERMGTDINLTAIDEFADVSKRFEFLSAQQIDLERAVDQLAKAIDKINKTSRKLFKDTFTSVNATFKEVFPRLFRGGHANLSLSSEEGDILEAGVEIFAQPPGKKNVTVDQLSGGEKALTAVALVFSIFLIKPSPFCILDEVDAPLDEANVDRYNEIVREMTDRSQFIVITHNKRTMEAADNLYGVTMQEPGVSKLVNVNLAKVGGGVVDRSATKHITNVASVS